MTNLSTRHSLHWLTSLTCSGCERDPQDSLVVHKCPLGHLLCNTCYQDLSKEENRPRCSKCSSTELLPQSVSADFLQKLKLTPGIGRCRRYANTFSSESSLTPSQGSGMKEISLNKEEERVRSRRPLRCPHHPCTKTISRSFLSTHCDYDHKDIPRYSLLEESCPELCLQLPISTITEGSNSCLGIITTSRLGTFWFMAAGSCGGYAIFWLLAGLDEEPRVACKIQALASDRQTKTSVQCFPRTVHDSHDVEEVARSLDCLCLTYPTIKGYVNQECTLLVKIKVLRT